MLLATLAVRAGYLSPAQFDEALASSENSPFFEGIVARGWVSPQLQQELQQQAAAKMQEHGGDIWEALRAVSKEGDDEAAVTTDHPSVQTSSPSAVTNNADPAQTIVMPSDFKTPPVAVSANSGSGAKTTNAAQKSGDPTAGSPASNKESLVRLIQTVSWKAESRSRYSLTRVQSKGGLGQVWLAVDGHLNREVALKEILPAGQKNPEVFARLLKEAQITGQLERPNIVPVYELSRDDEGKPFYTMRFLRGQALHRPDSWIL